MTLNLIELSAAKNEAVGRIRSVIDTSSSCEDKRLFIGWNGRKTAGHPWEFFVEIKRPDRYRSLYEIRAPNLKSENFLPGGAEIFRQFFVFFWPRFKWVVEQTSAWNGPVHWRSGAEHVRLLFSPRKKRSSDPIEWDRPPCNQNPGTHTLEPQKKKVFIYTSHKGTRHQSEAGRTSRDLEMEIFGRQKIKGFPGTRVPVGQKKKRGSCVSWTAFVICLICLYLLYIWYKRINLKMMIFFRQVSLISCRCLLFFIFVFLSFYSLMQLKQRTHIAAMTKTKMRKCF